MNSPRRVRVRALAKINLDLRVLAKRPDGFHELRTIFQTISLADSLEIDFTPGRKTVVELEDALASGMRTAHDSGAFQHAEMLGDGLAGKL